MAYQSTIKAMDDVLQLLWGDILDDQSLSITQNERIKIASDLIYGVKAELEAELKEEKSRPPFVPRKCCKLCGNRETQVGANLFCPIKGKDISGYDIFDDFKSLLGKADDN